MQGGEDRRRGAGPPAPARRDHHATPSQPICWHLGDGLASGAMLDLGVAASAAKGQAAREASRRRYRAGYRTPSSGGRRAPDAGADLRPPWAITARTAWLAGRHTPTGEIEPYRAARAAGCDPTPPSQRPAGPDAPIWLDHYLVLKAIAPRCTRAFRDCRGDAARARGVRLAPGGAPAATPLLARDPAAPWKIALASRCLQRPCRSSMAGTPTR